MQHEEQKKLMKKNEQSLGDLWDTIKNNNIQIIGIPERREREKGAEMISGETMAQNYPY